MSSIESPQQDLGSADRVQRPRDPIAAEPATELGALVLSRRPGESIAIGNDIYVDVVEIRGKRARLRVRAPKALNISREEKVSPGPNPAPN